MCVFVCSMCVCVMQHVCACMCVYTQRHTQTHTRTHSLTRPMKTSLMTMILDIYIIDIQRKSYYSRFPYRRDSESRDSESHVCGDRLYTKDADTNSQKSVPQYIYYVKSICRGLLRNCCLPAYLEHEVLELAAACVCVGGGEGGGEGGGVGVYK